MASAQKHYHLEIIGGNAVINYTKLSQDASQNLVAQPQLQQPPCLVAYTPGSGLLAVPDAQNTFAVLQGPSGKGEYRLRASSNVQGNGPRIGSTTCYEDWEVVEEGPRLWLRYKDPSRRSHWVAAREAEDEHGNAAWSPWWLAPGAANMGDFQQYVSIDIQLVPVGIEERERRR